MPNLYVTEQGARIEREYGRIVVAKNREVLLDVPAIKVSDIVLVGNVGVTTPAMQMLLEGDIGLVLLNRSGEFLGRLAGNVNSNTKLKRLQYKKSESSEFRLDVARGVVLGKLWNCRVRCMRIGSGGGNLIARKSAERLRVLIKALDGAPDIASVRAIEGQGARAYFACIRFHIAGDWEFPSRQRRPPPDPVNVLLSATYTLLTEAVYSAVTMAGLDPFCGFYHSERPGRPALVLDMMEEFRPLIADSVVLTLLRNNRLSYDDFRTGSQERPVILKPEAYKKVLVGFSDRLREHITIPQLRQRTTYHRLLEYQARRLRAAIEGRQPEYEPFKSR